MALGELMKWIVLFGDAAIWGTLQSQEPERSDFQKC